MGWLSWTLISWKSRASPFEGDHVDDLWLGIDVASGPSKATCGYDPNVPSVAYRWPSLPPDGVKPNPDYVPEVGEWFWWTSETSGWQRYQLQEGSKLKTVKGVTTGIGWISSDKGKCLPAAPPK